MHVWTRECQSQKKSAACMTANCQSYGLPGAARRLPGRDYIRRSKMRRLCNWRLATGSRLAFPGLDLTKAKVVGTWYKYKQPWRGYQGVSTGLGLGQEIG
eukprot:scaffold4557_cov74-Cyclotella_meneghiniana.AAC.5